MQEQRGPQDHPGGEFPDDRGHADALGQSAQQPGNRQQDSYRGEEDEKTVRGQRRYRVHISPLRS
jgi:hypothetical protein